MHTETQSRYRGADLESGREASILARALELASEGAKSAVSAEDAWRATSVYAHCVEDWPRVAASAARALGLHPDLREGPPVDLPRDRPALVRLGPGQWLVALGRRGRKLEVVLLDERGDTRRTMTRKQLIAASNGQPWLHLQPLLALDPISTTRRPHLGKHPWLRLRAFLGLEKRELWVVMVYAIVVGALTLATPVAVQSLVNTVAFGSVLQPLVVLTLLLLGGLTFAGMLTVLEAYVVEVLQRRVFIRVADDFGRRLPILQTEALDSKHGPELVNRFFDVLTIQKSLAVLLLDGLTLILQTAIGMVLLGFYHPLLLAFDFVLVFLLIVVFLMGRGAVQTGYEESSAKYRTAAWLEDLSRISHLVRGASAQQQAAQYTDMLCRDYITARKRHFRILLRQITGGVGLQVIAMVALLGVGGWLVINRQLTLGQLVAAELVIAAMGSGFVKLGKSLEKLYDLNVGILKIAKVVDIPIERRGGEPLPEGGPAPIALREVALKRGSQTLLSGASLEIAAGDRLRTPAAGSVHVDGLDLRRADLGSVRDHMALVRGTEFVVGSVLDNLRVTGHPHLDERTVRDALRKVSLEEDIDALHDGLGTMMLPSGAPLSESQARRLALVRALLARPRVLLLDRALDRLGLEPQEKNDLLDCVLSDDAPWTTVVVTDDEEVAARCNRTVTLRGRTLEVVQ